MQGFADSLERFNRKERNLLMRDALGHKASLPLLLDASYCRRVGEKIGFEFRPADAWWATDYHISWLAGALALYTEGEASVGKKHGNKPSETGRRLVEGNQEDIDLVIAVGNRVILVEAKAYGRFTNKQMGSKLARLDLLRTFQLGLPGAAERPVEFYLLLTSPLPEPNLAVDWTSWGHQGTTAPWMKLEIDPSANVLTVTRCDRQGNPSSTEDLWGVFPYSH